MKPFYQGLPGAMKAVPTNRPAPQAKRNGSPPGRPRLPAQLTAWVNLASTVSETRIACLMSCVRFLRPHPRIVRLSA